MSRQWYRAKVPIYDFLRRNRKRRVYAKTRKGRLGDAGKLASVVQNGKRLSRHSTRFRSYIGTSVTKTGLGILATSDRWQIWRILSEVRIIVERKKGEFRNRARFLRGKVGPDSKLSGYVATGDEALFHNSRKEQRA